MEKKKTTSDATVTLEHITIEPLSGAKVRLTADEGWLVKSKNTGHTWKHVVCCRPQGYEAVPDLHAVKK